VLLIYFGNGDDFLFDYAALLNHTSGRKFFAYHRGFENKETATALINSGIPMESVSGSLFHPTFLHTIDLILIAAKNWKALEDKKNLSLNQFPSLLIIHKSDGNNRLLSRMVDSW
jgi:hypothetical protein